MADPFLSEIRIFGFNFNPRGWATCDGQILPINQNQSLFSLLGTTYGGDGRTSFALPDLRGRTPFHFGTGTATGATAHNLGSRSGEESVALSVAQIPNHSHTLQASTEIADQSVPAGRVFAQSPVGGISNWSAAPGSSNANSGFVANAGSGSGHNNMQPYLTLNFCIALQGLFPSRN